MAIHLITENNTRSSLNLKNKSLSYFKIKIVYIGIKRMDIRLEKKWAKIKNIDVKLQKINNEKIVFKII